jgi:hypothetical protein
VASFLQEGLVRPPKDWTPESDPKADLVAEMGIAKLENSKQVGPKEVREQSKL